MLSNLIRLSAIEVDFLMFRLDKTGKGGASFSDFNELLNSDYLQLQQRKNEFAATKNEFSDFILLNRYHTKKNQFCFCKKDIKSFERGSTKNKKS